MSTDYSGMDEVLDDIERSEALDLDAGGETELDRPMSRLSVKQPSAHLGKAPTMEDLKLGQRVLALERERDAMAAELRELKAKQVQTSSTTIPAPRTITADTGAKIEVPHDLIPVLSVLRHHITELQRDNHALRYTFGLDSSSPVASSSKITLELPVLEQADDVKGKKADVGGVDLDAVVRRVRELVRENEELGDLVVEAGQASSEEWQRALEDSKKVITSLDNDLQHHFDTVQGLRQQLDAYVTHFGPLPSATRPSGGSGSGARGQSVQPPSPRSSQGRHSRDKDRRGGGGGGGRQSLAGGQHGSEGRDRRDRDRGGDRDRDRGGRGGQSQSGRGDRPNGSGQGGGASRREDDRASKRRR